MWPVKFVFHWLSNQLVFWQNLFKCLELRKEKQKSKKRKNNTLPIFSDCLSFGGSLSVLSQSIYNSALGFSSGLHESWRLARNENFSLIRLFMNMCPAMGMNVAFSILQYTQKLLTVFIPPHTSFPIFFFPRLFSLSITCPDCYSFPQAMPDNTYAFKYFWQKPPRNSWEFSESGEIKVCLYTSPRGSHGSGWNIQSQCFGIWSILLLLAISTCTKNVGLRPYGCSSPGEWGVYRQVIKSTTALCFTAM